MLKNVIVEKWLFRNLYIWTRIFICYNLRFNKNYNSHQILDGFNNKEKDSIFALNQYVDHLARGLSVSL